MYSEQMDKYYVTTSIPYVNAPAHLGHALEFVYADVLARYYRQGGLGKVLFSTGTDEHGSKIAQKALEVGMAPKQLAEQNSREFFRLLQALEISNDRFIRTTDKGHEQRAQIIWQNLKNDIYKNKYVGLYCVGCESFVTETESKENNNSCPIHSQPYQKVEEVNYFFRLSKYSNQIKQAIEEGVFKIVPEGRKNEILSLIKEGLEDISISRPVDKLNWGIAVPGDKQQVMYVWFEALLNYITVLGYPEHDDFKTYWPADVQVIGKDIIRFHAAIWPGILIALGLPLPNALYVHGFINVDGKKMSKSIGNVVSPAEIIEKYSSDVFRYYFMRHIPSYDDGDFTWEKLDAAYNNELANELGNALQRVSAMLVNYQNGIIGDIPPFEHDIYEYQEAITIFRFDKALDEVWEQIKGLNQYIDVQKPWEIHKRGDDLHLQEVLVYCASCLLEIGHLLEPFMPDTAKKIKFVLGEGIVKPLGQPLFPKAEN
jgi:methionyl-tRNA synthetase